MFKSKNNFFRISFILVLPIVIYFYFLKWRTNSIHDDDLFVFRDYSNVNNIFEAFHKTALWAQFRPLRDIVLLPFLNLFHKDCHLYFLLNVVVQALNTIIFAYILNLIIRSIYVSFFCSLLLALSRFCYYNMVMVFSGAILEGLAMTFFLLCLYQIVKICLDDSADLRIQKRRLLYSILFANLSMYTHERYIVLLGFIELVIMFFPATYSVPKKTRFIFSTYTIGSILLNIAIKKFLLSVPFLSGTAGTKIKFSPVDALVNLGASICSILHLNVGPEYIIGYKFQSLPDIHKTAALIVVAFILVSLFTYLFFAVKSVKKENESGAVMLLQLKFKANKRLFVLFRFLVSLFFLCLIPPVFQIRIELRWFQSCQVILILMVVIALYSIDFKNKNKNTILLVTFVLLFWWTDNYYLQHGAKNLYFSTSARIGDSFDQAIKDGRILKGKSKLYILEKRRDEGREGEIKWSLVNGYFFNLYQTNNEEMIFADSIYSRKDSLYVYSFPNFDKNNEQIICLDIGSDEMTFNYKIENITELYLRDSLKSYFANNHR